MKTPTPLESQPSGNALWQMRRGYCCFNLTALLLVAGFSLATVPLAFGETTRQTIKVIPSLLVSLSVLNAEPRFSLAEIFAPVAALNSSRYEHHRI